MNKNEFLNIKTNYQRIMLYTAIAVITIIILTIAGIFIAWNLYGSGARGGQLAVSYGVDYLLLYGPITLVSGFLVFKTITNYSKKALEQFKVYVLTLAVVIFVFLISWVVQSMY